MFLTLTTPEITENMPVHRLLYRIHVYGRPFYALYSLNSNHTTTLALGQINDEESAFDYWNPQQTDDLHSKREVFPGKCQVLKLTIWAAL